MEFQYPNTNIGHLEYGEREAIRAWGEEMHLMSAILPTLVR